VPKPQRPNLAFVPGFMQRGDAWRGIAALISERYPSACLDPRGGTWEACLAEVVEATRGAVAVGYSFGGRLALHAALSERGEPAGLVLVGASAGIEDRAERDSRRLADEELAAWMEAESIERVVERWESLPVFHGQSQALVAAQRPGRLSHDPPTLARLLRSGGQGARRPLWHRLGELECPLLAVAGVRDSKYVDAARRMAAAAPRGRTAVLPGAGHAPQLEQPERFAALLLEFLDEHFGERVRLDRDAAAGSGGHLE
jgi:2-succinyl-6-hydroxy-2,4-cyclohexadiene-1-carboxylate synthase